MTDDDKLTRSKAEEIELKARYDFLIAMYKGMWDNINRHVTVLWQSTALLATAVGAALLLRARTGAANTDSAVVQPGVDSSGDIGVALVIAACFWLIAHSIDTSTWYNRNIQIIGNIEAEFFKLMPRSTWVHPYGTGSWEAPKGLLPYTKLQATFGVLIGAAAYTWHLISRVLPDLSFDSRVDITRALPSALLVVGVIATVVQLRKHRQSLVEFDQKLEKERNTP